MTDFKLDFLDNTSDEALVAEMKRVSAIVAPNPLTSTLFARYAKVSAATLRRRFGGWRSALEAAGLDHLYSGRVVTAAMKEQSTRRLTDDELLETLKIVASELGTQVLTNADFHGRTTVGVDAYRRRFGSWENALRLAGLEVSSLGKRYSEAEYFRNLAEVWTFLGRQPSRSDVGRPPSEISPGAYEARFGGWRKALTAFVKWANFGSNNVMADDSNTTERVENLTVLLPLVPSATAVTVVPPEDRRHVPDRIRWRVFERDNFTCVVCGRSRAKGDDIKLHADHILPWSKGGKTVIENLQSLCETCNLGKGNRHPTQTN